MIFQFYPPEGQFDNLIIVEVGWVSPHYIWDIYLCIYTKKISPTHSIVYSQKKNPSSTLLPQIFVLVFIEGNFLFLWSIENHDHIIFFVLFVQSVLCMFDCMSNFFIFQNFFGFWFELCLHVFRKWLFYFILIEVLIPWFCVVVYWFCFVYMKYKFKNLREKKYLVCCEREICIVVLRIKKK